MVKKVEMSGDVKVVSNGEEKCKAESPATEPRRTRGASVAVSRYSVNYGIPSRKSVHDFVILEHGPDSWRVKIHEFLEQKWVEWALLALLCLDIIIIFTEMFLMTEYPHCGIIERDCLACCPYEGTAEDAANNRWLAESYCDAGYDVTGFASCDDHKWEAVHKIETVLFSFTIIILCIFMTEISLEMAALGVKKFFSQLFLALDFFVISVSLIFELIFYIQKSKLQEIFAILVIFRVWRFIRVGHALVEVSSELTSNQYECIFEYIKECEKALKANKIPVPEKSEDIKFLIEENEGHCANHH